MEARQRGDNVSRGYAGVRRGSRGGTPSPVPVHLLAPLIQVLNVRHQVSPRPLEGIGATVEPGIATPSSTAFQSRRSWTKTGTALATSVVFVVGSTTSRASGSMRSGSHLFIRRPTATTVTTSP